MKRRLLHVCIVVLLAALAIFSFSVHAAVPKGAVPAKKCERFRRGKVYCGWVKHAWVPGRALPPNLFYPNFSERANLLRAAKRAKGKRKEKLTKQIEALEAKMEQNYPICAPGPKGKVPTPTPTPAPIKFDFSGAVGLGIGTPRDVGRGRLVKAKSDGQVLDALISGRTEVDGFFIAPNHKIYVSFMQKTSLSGGDPNADGCYLADVNLSTGIPACLDSQCAVNPSPSPNGVLPGSDAYFNQFDSDGAMYTLALCDNKRVLRKYPSTGAAVTVADLPMESTELGFWYLLPDKSVLMSGHDLPLSTPVSAWFKRLAPGGAVTTIGAYEVNSPKKFPDGNLLVRYNDAWLYDPAANVVDVRTYAGCTNFSHYYDRCYGDESVHDVSDLCNDPQLKSFCDNVREFAAGIYTWNSIMYGVFGEGSPDGVSPKTNIMQVYPGFSPVNSVVSYVTQAQGIQKYLILAGYDVSSQWLMTILDLETRVETTLLSQSSKFYDGHYHLSSSGDRVWFDGRSSADGSSGIIGWIDLAAQTAAILPSEAMVDFQAF